jgi:hypothetical protein
MRVIFRGLVTFFGMVVLTALAVGMVRWFLAEEEDDGPVKAVPSPRDVSARVEPLP